MLRAMALRDTLEFLLYDWLRAGELTKIVDKAELALALTDSRIADEIVACAKTSKFLKQVVNFDGTSNHDAELDRVALSKPVRFDAVIAVPFSTVLPPWCRWPRSRWSRARRTTATTPLRMGRPP